MHTALPFIKVNVKAQKFTFALESSHYEVYRARFSLPITLNMTGIESSLGVKIDGTIY